MAGLFGLFNYEKEGPGISKDAPKKKGFIIFFETFFRNFWKFMLINIVYSILSLLVVSNGFANVGITNVARNTARDKHSFGLSDFFETGKKNFKQALIAGIINVIIYGILILDFIFFSNIKGWFSTISLGVALFGFFTFTLMNYYVWTLIITFKFTLKQVYRNSFKFAFINLKYNLLCFFANVLIIALNILIIVFFPNYLVITFQVIALIIIYPAFNALLVQYCTFPSIKKYIIDPYYAEHPDEDIEKRKNLGVYQQEEIEEKTAVVDGTNELEEEEDDGVIFED